MLGVGEVEAGAGLGEADQGLADQAGGSPEVGGALGGGTGLEPGVGDRDEGLGLGLAAALDAAGDGGVAAALLQEDEAVDVGGGGDAAQEGGVALAQGALGVGRGRRWRRRRGSR